METQNRRYRAFISYSQRDKALAKRLHRALETYRVPKGIEAPVGPDRRLGRFFRDDDEMGASQSLGKALEGALDDAQNLIVICSPASARSTWVDAEVRRFKRRGSSHVFAVIVDGQPHAKDFDQECFPPALKVKINAQGWPTGEPDEPRAPDLRREGMDRVRAQLAAGLLRIPFDQLWQRDRRRARQNRLIAVAAGLIIATTLGVVGAGWLSAQRDTQIQAADQAIDQARRATAEGRIGEALKQLTPFLAHRDTRQKVEGPLRAVLGWVPDPYASVPKTGIVAARLRDATVLLDAERGAYDVSDVGLELERFIRSRDGRRLIAIGDQRAIVLDARTGQRTGQVDNGEVGWIGHAFEAPSGLIVITGALFGSTIGSISPFTLTVSADGKTVERKPIRAPLDFGDGMGVTPACDALTVAVDSGSVPSRFEAHALGAERLGDATVLAPPHGASAPAGARFGGGGALLGEAKRNPFGAAGWGALGLDDGVSEQPLMSKKAHVVTLEPSLALEDSTRWTPVAAVARKTAVPPTYVPSCSNAQPCPVVGGRTGETFVPEDTLRRDGDQVGPPPLPRWSRTVSATGSDSGPIYFDHRVANAGHQLAVCRPREGKDVCLHVAVMGEDRFSLPFLRSADGRYLFWSFGGAVFDLETLQPLTADRTLPTTPGSHFDFEMDRHGLTFAVDKRLVTYAANATGARWTRTDDERASPPLGVLDAGAGGKGLHTLASLGGRQYLAARGDGTLARIDAATGQEVWHVGAVGLGEIRDVQLNPERRHVVLMGTAAWRVFRLDDGFAVSGLLVPPLGSDGSVKLDACRLADAVGPQGQIAASCGARSYTWEPQKYEGEMEPYLARLMCATDVKGSALETVRRCYLK